LPTLSFVGASLTPPCFRFHTPLIEPDVRVCRIRLSEKTHAIAEAIACGPSYTKTAHVFMSQTTAEGYHVGNQVCYSTNRSIDCFPDEPRQEYRFEMEGGTFSTLRFIASDDGLDALALIFERKDKNTLVHYRLVDKAADLSKPYTIGISYFDKDEGGRVIEREAHYRLYPDAPAKPSKAR
jgi:hypothetical protein